MGSGVRLTTLETVGRPANTAQHTAGVLNMLQLGSQPSNEQGCTTNTTESNRTPALVQELAVLHIRQCPVLQRTAALTWRVPCQRACPYMASLLTGVSQKLPGHVHCSCYLLPGFAAAGGVGPTLVLSGVLQPLVPVPLKGLAVHPGRYAPTIWQRCQALTWDQDSTAEHGIGRVWQQGMTGQQAVAEEVFIGCSMRCCCSLH